MTNFRKVLLGLFQTSYLLSCCLFLLLFVWISFYKPGQTGKVLNVSEKAGRADRRDAVSSHKSAFHVLWYRDTKKTKHENWPNKVKPDSMEKLEPNRAKLVSSWESKLVLTQSAPNIQCKVRFGCPSRARFNRAVWHIAPSDSVIWQRMDTLSLFIWRQTQPLTCSVCLYVCVQTCVCMS